jgi:hypothetical protein
MTSAYVAHLLTAPHQELLDEIMRSQEVKSRAT